MTDVSDFSRALPPLPEHAEAQRFEAHLAPPIRGRRLTDAERALATRAARREASSFEVGQLRALARHATPEDKQLLDAAIAANEGHATTWEAEKPKTAEEQAIEALEAAFGQAVENAFDRIEGKR